jgi:hypothetical protein
VIDVIDAALERGISARDNTITALSSFFGRCLTRDPGIGVSVIDASDARDQQELGRSQIH